MQQQILLLLLCKSHGVSSLFYILYYVEYLVLCEPWESELVSEHMTVFACIHHSYSVGPCR